MKYRIAVYEEQVSGFTIEASSEEEAARLAAEYWDELDALSRDEYWEDTSTHDVAVVREDADAPTFVRRDPDGNMIEMRRTN